MLALVFFLVSTILALQKITNGLDETITAVVEIIEKTEPVDPIVDDINANLDAAVDALEGLLVKKAGMQDADGPRRRALPRRRGRGLAQLPGEHERQGAADLGGLHARHADAGPARARGTDRGRQPGRTGAARPRYGSLAARQLYPGARPGRSPIIGTDSPVQYEERDADSSAV